MPVRGTNLAGGEVEAIGTVLAQAFVQEGQRVVAPAELTAILERGQSPAAAAAQVGAREYVVTTAVRLQSRIALQSTLHAVDGAVLFSAAINADSMDDMLPACARLARSLVSRVPPDAARTHRTVTRAEAGERQRTFTEKVMGVKASVIQLLHPDDKFEPAVGLQFSGRLEMDRAFLEIGAGFTAPPGVNEKDADVGSLFAELGGSYYLADGDLAPYAGAGALLKLHMSDDYEGAANIAPYGQIGLMFFRESSSRIYVDLRVAQHLLPMKRILSDIPLSGSGGDPASEDGKSMRPTEIGLLFGVGW